MGFVTGEHADESFGLKRWQEKIYMLMIYFVQVMASIGALQCILLFDGDIWLKFPYTLLITYAFGQIDIQACGLFLLFTPSLCKMMCFFEECR